MAAYLTLAGNNEKDKAKSHAYYARAILSLERAQEHGVLKDPKNNYNLVSMYYSVGQFATATELLSAGLRNNTINSTEQNWRILAYCYHAQINENDKAIERRFTRRSPAASAGVRRPVRLLYRPDLHPAGQGSRRLHRLLPQRGGEGPPQLRHRLFGLPQHRLQRL